MGLDVGGPHGAGDCVEVVGALWGRSEEVDEARG